MIVDRTPGWRIGQAIAAEFSDEESYAQQFKDEADMYRQRAKA